MIITRAVIHGDKIKWFVTLDIENLIQLEFCLWYKWKSAINAVPCSSFFIVSSRYPQECSSPRFSKNSYLVISAIGHIVKLKTSVDVWGLRQSSEPNRDPESEGIQEQGDLQWCTDKRLNSVDTLCNLGFLKQINTDLKHGISHGPQRV